MFVRKKPNKCGLSHSKTALQQTTPLDAYIRFSDWVVHLYNNNLQKGANGSALPYANNQLLQLESYLLEGRIKTDNNLTENSIRPLALDRMNCFFQEVMRALNESL